MDRPSGSPLARFDLESRLPALIDVAIVFGLIVLTLADRSLFARDRDATIVLVILPLLVRRRFPVPVLFVVAAAVVLTTARAGWIDVAAVALASYTVGDRVEDRLTSPLSALAVALLMGLAFTMLTTDPALSVTLPLVVIVPSWVVGSMIRGRRVDAARRAADEERALAERERALRATVADERRHIAHELHDVVAHAVSVMVIQAGAARQVLRSEPDAAETSLLAVESTGREAMTELRRLLGVLGDEDDAGGLAPRAGVAQLETLVRRVRDAGLPTELHVAGEARPLPAGVDVTVYRIVQEALTNALRYAARARTEVRLTYQPSEVQVEILDEGPAAAPEAGTAGRGLIGLRERAALFGGMLEAGPRLDHGFAVRARLPLEPASGPAT